ncbi:Uu.00g050820.m01.CDS01 [Anthostomella pinea]|uniref:Uu.00g050820.m01.CDS01 n=1 Tax=Anthostomella pinea TaxID=933095 RepID=A0AAI8VTK0_9PEZI|nr:Uu.00g050820.m01.CDS01 [Anthostomella pinea]
MPSFASFAIALTMGMGALTGLTAECADADALTVTETCTETVAAEALTTTETCTVTDMTTMTVSNTVIDMSVTTSYAATATKVLFLNATAKALAVNETITATETLIDLSTTTSYAATATKVLFFDATAKALTANATGGRRRARILSSPRRRRARSPPLPWPAAAVPEVKQCIHVNATWVPVNSALNINNYTSVIVDPEVVCYINTVDTAQNLTLGFQFPSQTVFVGPPRGLDWVCCEFTSSAACPDAPATKPDTRGLVSCLF